MLFFGSATFINTEWVHSTIKPISIYHCPLYTEQCTGCQSVNKSHGDIKNFSWKCFGRESSLGRRDEKHEHNICAMPTPLSVDAVSAFILYNLDYSVGSNRTHSILFGRLPVNILFLLACSCRKQSLKLMSKL